MNLSVGVIGCGNISKFHLAGLAKAGVDVRWACDLSEQASKPWVEKFNARYTNDYHEVIADKNIQAVFILTISSTHKAICLDAIRADKAVICEKTLAENAADSLEIVRAAQHNGCQFYTSYMKRFIPAVQTARNLLPSLGTIFSTYIRSYQPWGDIWHQNPADGFFRTPPGGTSAVIKNYGGGILVCGGSHILDLTGFLLGRPSRLYASMIQPADRDYDLLASVMLETPNGVVHFEAAGHPLTKIGHHRDGWDERIEINGTQGRIEIYSAFWDQIYVKDSLLMHYDNRSGCVTEYRSGPVSPFEGADAFFCDQIARGEQGEQSITTGYDVDELIETIKTSARLKQALEIDWKIG